MNINDITTTMRPKRHLIAIILSAAVLIPYFSSCSDDLRYPAEGDYDGDEICTPVSLSVLPIQSENPQSRAIEYIYATENETKIHDFWIIEYNEEGVRIGLPRYYTEAEGAELPQDIRILVPRREGDKYTCVLIANSNDPNLFNADNRSKFSTINDLRKFEMATHNHEHVYDPDNNKYLLMSGWTTITTDPATHKLSFDLVRNECKVNVKLTNFPRQFISLQILSVARRPIRKSVPSRNCQLCPERRPRLARTS